MLLGIKNVIFCDHCKKEAPIETTRYVINAPIKEYKFILNVIEYKKHYCFECLNKIVARLTAVLDPETFKED